MKLRPLQDKCAGESRVAKIITILVLSLLAFQVVGGWVYRETLYWSIPVAPGDAYGLGDVIELLIAIALLGTCGIALLVGAVFALVPRLRHWPRIAALGGAGLLAVPVYFVVHSHLIRGLDWNPP